MSYQVIARKWRPQTFNDLVGQTHVTATLSNAIKNNRVAHAYIFSGARGVGKTTAARILAKALNCLHGPTAEPCGECDSCKEIAAGTSLDVIEIDAASNRGIDQIRELREMVRYAPAASRRKIVILDEAHMLTGEASNALLKTLEEPPEQVVFVMATTEPEKLPDTIRSRSQHFHFRALTFAEITARLEEIAKRENLSIEPGAYAVMARIAEGSLRDALSLLEQARAYCGETITDKDVRELLGVVPEDSLNELVEAIAEGSADRALALVHTFQKEGRNLQHFCREAIRHIRNLLIARVSGADSELIAATPDQRPALAKAAALFSEEDLTRFFQILLQTDDDLRKKLDARVHLEMGLLRLINAKRLAPLEELLAEVRQGSPGTESNRGGAKGAVAGAPGAFSSRTTGAGSGSGEVKNDGVNIASAQETRSEVRAAGAFPPAFGRPAAASTTATAGAATATAPARAEASAATEATGISAEDVAQIKTAIQAQQKFLGELVEQSSRWELEGGELRIYFAPEKSSFLGLIDGRETLEKIRTVASKVLGRPLRVCAKLEISTGSQAKPAAGSGGAQELRGQFERDPIVRSMIQRFGGKISEVRREKEE